MQNSFLIKINNVSQNQIINKLSKIKISLLKIYTINNDVYIKIFHDDYQKVKKCLRLYDIEVINIYGPKKVNQLVKQYYVIIIGFLFALIIIFFSSHFIVDVDIIHENEDLKQLLFYDLEKYGVKKFSFKKNYFELTKIKKQIKNKHLDRIEWLEISTSGMRYIIRVEERIITKPEIEKEYCHVIAQKDGIIKSIQVYNGEGMVGINDYVRKGDILISGDVKRNDEVVSHNCADGKVYGEVWYQINVKVPLNYYEEVLTDKKRHNIVINYDGNDYKLFKDRLVLYQIDKKKIFDLLGIKIYLETDKEIKRKVAKYSSEEALNKGLQLSKEKIILKLKSDERIIDEKILQKTLIDSTMNMDIFIIVEEDIGQQIEEKGDVTDDL